MQKLGLSDKIISYRFEEKKKQFKKLFSQFRKKYIIRSKKIDEEEKKNPLLQNLIKISEDKEKLKKEKLHLKLINQILGKEKIYKLSQKDSLKIISYITQNNKCTTIFSELIIDDLIAFFNLCLNEILNGSESYNICITIFNNVILDDDQENTVFLFLKKNNQILEKLMEILNSEKYSKNLIKMVLELFFVIFDKKEIEIFEKEFIIKFCEKIEKISFFYENENDIIVENIIISVSLLISYNPEMIYYEKIPNILEFSKKRFKLLDPKNSKNLDISFSLISLFATYIFLNENNKKNQNFILNEIPLLKMKQFLDHENNKVKKFAMWYFSNSIIEFPSLEKYEIWEDLFNELMTKFLIESFEGVNSIQEESIICLKNLFEKCSFYYLKKIVVSNIYDLTFYFNKILNLNNFDVLNECIDIMILLVRIEEFRKFMKENSDFKNRIEDLQKSEELGNKVGDFIELYFSFD